MRKFEKTIRITTDVFSYISIIATAAMMLLSVADVILRKFFNAPITGATELVQMLNVSVFLALGTGCLTGQNIAVEFIMEKLPKAPRHAIQIFVYLVSLAVLVVLVWRTWVIAMFYKDFGYVYSLLKIPQWYFVMVLDVGFFTGILAVIMMLINEVRMLCGKPYLDSRGKGFGAGSAGAVEDKKNQESTVGDVTNIIGSDKDKDNRPEKEENRS